MFGRWLDVGCFKLCMRSNPYSVCHACHAISLLVSFSMTVVCVAHVSYSSATEYVHTYFYSGHYSPQLLLVVVVVGSSRLIAVIIRLVFVLVVIVILVAVVVPVIGDKDGCRPPDLRGESKLPTGLKALIGRKT